MNKKLSANKRAVLSADALREHVSYDARTGIFVWKRRRWRSAKGAAGCTSAKGYIVITINDIQYSAHHLAWLYHYGEWPAQELDHKDLNKSNNQISNLREALPIQNRANTKPRAASGFKGVRKKWNRWEASIVHEGNYMYLGTFDTAELAAASYESKARELHGEFARAA